MDIRSYNRAVLVDKKVHDLINRGITKKVIVFVFYSPVSIGESVPIQFPFCGQVRKVTASCRVAGSEGTLIKVQKISRIDFENSEDTWVDVTAFLLAGGSKAYEKDITGIGVINGDYFKVTILQASVDIEDMTIEVIVEI